MSCRSVGSKRHVFLRKKSILASFFLHITIKHKKNRPKAVIKRSVFYRKIFLKSFPCPYLPPTILVPSPCKPRFCPCGKRRRYGGERGKVRGAKFKVQGSRLAGLSSICGHICGWQYGVSGRAPGGIAGIGQPGC